MARAVELQTGDRVGPYELVAHVGSGGFASVWLGRRKGPGGFEVRVALKLMRIELVNDASFENMFIDEAKVAALIEHPNVVKIFELGTEGDTLYMAMEYVRGRPLSALRNLAQRAGRRIPIEILMRILADTCAGLHAAHELTRDGKPLCVIHRDVSPENILVSDKGVVKLIDFGVAKANDRLATDTATGFAKGKVRYMAPEQALAKPLDRRADIWALGAVAFEVVEGRPPFDGDNDLARLMALVGTAPVPMLDLSVPPAYAKIIATALTRDPDLRYPTAAAMKAAIESALEESGAHVTADALVTFFGEWLVPDGPSADDDEEGGEDRLRKRLAGGASSHQETTDIGRVGAGSRQVETLGALDSSVALAAGQPRSSWPLVMVGLSAVVLGAVMVLWFGAKSTPTLASPTPAISVATASVIAVDSAPPPPPSPPIDVIAMEKVDPSPSMSASATPSTPGVAKKRPIVPTKKPRAPSAPRPRYDDTIQ